MSEYASPRNIRGPKRKFDYDEARRRRASGESVASIARSYGVSWLAIDRATNDRTRARMDAYSADYQKHGVCIDCGSACTKTLDRCIRCSAIHRSTSVRDTELKCITCQEWKPDYGFPRNRSKVTRRGRHEQCSSCGSAARARYRSRNLERDRARDREYRRRKRQQAMPSDPPITLP